MPAARPALAGVAVAAIAGAAAVASGSRPALLVAVAGLQLAVGVWWLAASGVPGRPAVAAVMGVAAAAADTLVYRDRLDATGALAGVVALAFVAAIAVQLGRRNRNRVTESLALTVTGVILVVLPALLLGWSGS